MIVAGASPLSVWAAIVPGVFGDPYALGQVVFKATPLVFTGLAVAVALDAGVFNIGGEGQMVAGGVACAAMGAALPAGTPMVLAVPLCLIAAAIAGGALGAATGALKAYRGAHEVIVGILLNAIVAGVVLWLGNAFLFVGDATATAAIVPGAELPELGIAGSSASAAVLVAIAAALATWWLVARTTVGLRWRMVGQGPHAARAAGLSVARAQVLAMAAAGALAGLAASSSVLGYRHAYQMGLDRNAGFLGIAVALLGRGRAVGVVAAALFLGVLQQAGLVVADQVPRALFDVIQAVIIVAVAATSPIVRRRLARAPEAAR
ncbi:MAG: ABC transporter permease [Deltaproteobacteria bacterium]|nr:ABC transporter permease [Deltaproteobacteria bacterium]